MNGYLLVFDFSQTDRSDVTKRLDKIGAIENWQAFFDNTICIASRATAADLGPLLREAMPNVRFIMTEVSKDNLTGWLPKSVWQFIRTPVPAEPTRA